MPIYPYLCHACGHEFERLQKVGDAPLVQCPDCGENSLRKKLTAAAFHLKGTGWYETDFKNKGANKAAGKATAGDTDAKPAEKTGETKSTDSGSDKTAVESSKKSESKKTESNG